MLKTIASMIVAFTAAAALAGCSQIFEPVPYTGQTHSMRVS